MCSDRAFKDPTMSSQIAEYPSGDSQHIRLPICEPADGPDADYGAIGEDSDVSIRIYRKNGSQISLQSASPTQGDDIRFLRHTGRVPRAVTTRTPHGSTHALDTGPLPDGLLVYPLLGNGLHIKPARVNNVLLTNMDEKSDDVLSEDWTMWLPRPRKTQTLETSSSPKKRKSEYPDYIAEITAPLATEEDFDFMIMPAILNSHAGAMKNSHQRRIKRRNVRNRIVTTVRKMFNRGQ